MDGHEQYNITKTTKKFEDKKMIPFFYFYLNILFFFLYGCLFSKAVKFFTPRN